MALCIVLNLKHHAFQFKTTEIYLVNRNITSIAPYAFINFTKLDTISLTTNIEQLFVNCKLLKL